MLPRPLFASQRTLRLLAYWLVTLLVLAAPDARAQVNPIVTENQKIGTTAWQLTSPAINGEIEGYASLTSVNRGGQIQLFVNTTESQYRIEVYRMGWYGGAGARLVLGPITRAGRAQVVPAPDEFGTVDCNWTDPYTITVPNTADATDWCSGYYLAKLTALTSGRQSYIMFVVRDDSRSASLLMQSAVTTFQAYNTYGGKSLYAYQSPSGRANKVSFNRPYALNTSRADLAFGVGAAEFLIGGDGGPPGGWEYNMVRFLEREGYNVTYCTNVDVHANPSLLLNRKGFLSVGHDEYWSFEMRRNVQSARDAGVSLGFFSANTMYWQIRFEPSPSTAAANRLVVSYKYFPTDYIGTDTNDPFYRDGDPSNDNQITVRFRDTLANSSRVAAPEEQLMGTMYDYGADNANNDIVVTNPSHWIFANTGLVNGSRLPGLLGYEVDRTQGSQPANTTIVARSPYTGNVFTGTGVSDMTVYTAANGQATVFATGSIQWAWGLDDWAVPTYRASLRNAAAQQMTRNVLNRFINGPGVGNNLVPSAVANGPYAATVGTPITFSAAGSSDSDGSIASYSWSFGDGTTATGINPSKTYTTAGNYTVTLTVTDNLGASATATTTATVSAENRYSLASADSVFDVTSDRRYFYPPSGVGDFIVPVPSEADRFNQWFSSSPQTLDEVTGILDTPINLYLSFSGRRTVNKVQLYQAAWFEAGSFHSKNVRIYLRQTGLNWIQVASGTLLNSNGALTEFSFPNAVADEARIEILSTYDTTLYRAVGLAEVVFLNTNNQPPIPAANGPYTADVGQAVSFSSAGTSDPDGTITAYAWNFGDGSTATGPNPVKAYSAPGTYTVTLTVTDSGGATVSASTTATVRGRYGAVNADSVFDVTSDKRYYYPASAVGDFVIPIPTPEDQFDQWFSASGLQQNAAGTLGIPVNLYMTFLSRQTVNKVWINQSAWSETGFLNAFKSKDIRLYLRQSGGVWTQVAAGTLANANGALLELTFPATVADEARIEVLSTYDNTTYSGVGLAEVEFFGAANQAPVAHSGGPYSGTTGVALQFDGSTSSDPDGTIASYAWNFGDGTTGTGANPTKTYAAAGTFTVTLTVTDNGGATATATTTATIAAPLTLASVSVNPASVTGGVSATGTVTLNRPAPAGGVVVTLSGNSTAATVPATVTVPENATTATFSIATTPVSANTSVTITAAYNGVSRTAVLDVTLPVVSALTFSPTVVAGTVSSTGTVTLSGPAPSGGRVVTLSDNNAAVTVPASITVPAGATTATFTATTTTVAVDTTVTVTAATGTTTVTAPLTVRAITLTLTLAPTSVTGGSSSTGTVTLSTAAPTGGAVVTLTDNSTVSSVPASVTIPAGSRTATFTITTTPVSANTTAAITAACLGLTDTENLAINAPSVSTLVLNPSSVVGGNSSTGTVTLNGSAPSGGSVVTLSDNNIAAQVPVSITVPAGATTATFTVTTTAVSTQQSVSVTAAANGVSRSTTLTITTPTIASLTLNPSSVPEGINSTATVTLTGPAPASGAVVTLRSSNTAVARVPASVTVPAGSRTATFTVTSQDVTGTRTATITGSYGGTSRTATITVTLGSTGTGLTGQYYNSLGSLVLTRLDPTVNFDWGSGGPGGFVGVDMFGARWTGKVQPLYSETYTFYTTSDDGVRLWVNGQLLIDNWTDHAATTNSGTITLQAGVKYDIRLEYYERSGSAVMRLEWQSPRQARQVVPTIRLFPQ